MNRLTPQTRFRRQIRMLLVTLLCVFGCLSQSSATHFRSANLSWTLGTNDTIIFNLNMSWRWTAFGNPALGTYVSISSMTFGDGTSTSFGLNVNSINTTDDWFSGSTVIKHKYPANGTYIAQYDDCCRIGGLMDGNSELDQLVRSVVTVGNGNNSPITLAPPIITLPLNVASTYQMPAFDIDGHTYTFSITPTSESALNTAAPAGLTLSPSGLISWTPTNSGLYAISITITDQLGATSTSDLILRVSNLTSNPPTFDYSSGFTPANGSVLITSPGNTLNFNVKAEDIDFGNTVTLNAVGMPPNGPTFTPVLPASGNPVTTAVSWTPTNAHIGAHPISFIATDNTGAQTITAVTINVTPGPVFNVPPSPVAGTGFCALTGVAFSQVVEAQNPVSGANVSITSMTGLPASATTSPALPTTPATIASTTLNWTPSVSEWGTYTVTFTAVDASNFSSTHSFNFIVNTSPSFTSALPPSSASVGSLYTYTITGTDPNVPYGDILAYQTIGLPSWLTLVDNGNGTAVLSGTPGCGNIGTFTFDIVLEDIYHHCGPHVEQNVTITVTGTAPSIVCPSNVAQDNDPGLCSAVVNYTLPTVTAQCPCPTPSVIAGYTDLGVHNGHRYFVSNTATDWTTAKNNAISLGGHLATVNDAAENTFLIAAGVAWIGFTDEAVEGTFVWSNGEPVTYTNWNAGEPNDLNGEDYTHLIGDGFWKDLGSASTLNYVVEFDCAGLYPLNVAHASGSVFPVGTTTVQYGYTDANGNAATACSFDVVVSDTTKPVVFFSNTSIPELLYYTFEGVGSNVPNLALFPPAGTATATIQGSLTQGPGICGNSLIGTGSSSATNFVNTGWAPNLGGNSWTMSFKTSNIQPNTTVYYILGDVNTNSLRCFTNGVAGPNNWILRGAGMNDVYINGGATVAPHTITFVYDNTLNNIQGYLDGNLVTVVNQGGVNWTGAGPFKVGGFASNTGLSPAGQLDEFRLYNRALNSSEVNALNTCGNAIAVNNDAGLCGSTISYATPTVADNCGVAGINSVPASGSFFPVGNSSVVWTATDIHSNTSTYTVAVTVTDTEAPTINCPSNITSTSSVVTYTVSASDNCGTPAITYSHPSGTSFPCGVTTVTVTATDANGLSSTCTFDVHITAVYGSQTETLQGCFTWAANGTTYTATGTYTHTLVSAAGCDSIVTLNLTILPGVYVNAKVILQGPYDPNTGLMSDSLRLKGLVPGTEPYSFPPYNKTAIGGPGGETVSGAVLAVGGPQAIVDWIFLELRDAMIPANVVANKRALLRRDGMIVSTDGVSPVEFPSLSNGQYLLSVKHRNHLGVMTSNALDLSGCTNTLVDLSSATPVYVNGAISNAPRKLIGGVYLLWSGDANNNKNVKYTGLFNDKEVILSVIGVATPNNVLYNVYRMEDVNMDGILRYNGFNNDRNVILNNVGVSTPNAILYQHTPN